MFPKNLILFAILYIFIDDSILPLYTHFTNIENNTQLTFPKSNIDYIIIDKFSFLIIPLFFVALLMTVSIKLNNYVSAIMIMYYKFVYLNIIQYNNCDLVVFEYRRNLFWLFTTSPLLQLYSECNNSSLFKTNAHYHIMSNILYFAGIYYKKTIYFYPIIVVIYIFQILFLYRLHKLSHFKYSNFIFNLWILFTVVHLLELTNLFEPETIQIYFSVCDLVSKLSIVVVVCDSEVKINKIKEDIDLQGINFITYLLDRIREFENDNIITKKNKYILNYTTNLLTEYIPNNTTGVKIELLQKILPFGFDNKYILSFSSSAISCKEYDKICILFTDIVSYTELAKRYDATTIYNLLNDVYNRFDKLIKKYAFLQKIETIGDAYMVVGDLYRNSCNFKETVKQIILLALEFIDIIKKIPTPDNVPLSLRIGIHIGNVVVGILGKEIPRLCVVGNSVNVAARLQSTADKNTIQLSHHIYEIANEFDMNILFSQKQNVFLKGIGTITTYNIYPPKDNETKNDITETE